MVVGLTLGAFALALCSSLGTAQAGRQVTRLKHAAPAPPPVTYDLYASYPNYREIAAGNFLTGTNTALPPGANGTVLWFQPGSGGTFKQFDTAPYDPCHWDLLRWNDGTRGQLVYLATHDECATDNNEIDFDPPIAFMPRAWTSGVPWTAQASSAVLYSEGGQAVCQGVNVWHSAVVGSTRLSDGAPAVHTQTDETQTLTPIAGAPASLACPAGAPSVTSWQENFFLSAALQIRRTDGTVAGDDWGLARSVGGNLAFLHAMGFQEWDSQFGAWQPLPPAGAVEPTAAAPPAAAAIAPDPSAQSTQ